jgi:hypothetical protein
VKRDPASGTLPRWKICLPDSALGDAIVDLATLTGAVVVALGDFYAGLPTAIRQRRHPGATLAEQRVAEKMIAVVHPRDAYDVSEAMDPISIFIGLTRRDLMAQAVRYLLFGEGETGLVVYTILLRYWDWTPEEDVRPLIFLMSD